MLTNIFEKLKQNEELWSLFTSKEEYTPLFLDKHERFPYYLSMHRNIFEPKVSKFLVENGLKIEIQENKKFVVCLTHDIDMIYISKKIYHCLRALNYRQFKQAFKILFSDLNREWNQLWNFKYIMELEEKYNAKSSFYLLALNRSNLHFNYEIEDLKNELGNIIDKGWEVGLHGGYEAYNNLDEILEEKKRLEKVLCKDVIGYRNHYLRFKIPDTWILLEKAGFKYDTTFAYADCVGFRNGMCHPFKPFNLKTNKEIEIYEIPLTIMDNTLFEKMGLDLSKAWNLTKMLIDTVEKYNGVITILWHNTSMIGDTLKFYEKILKYCYEKNAWMTSCEEVWRWWSKYTE
ncbi:MAG: polysaccharide deacetylase family protein [Candidatus Methanomethylicia archaeon]